MRSALVSVMALAACSGEPAETGTLTRSDSDNLPAPALNCDYTQPYGNAAHSGVPCKAQHNLRIIDQVVQDVDADEIAAEDGNFLQMYEGPPLTSADWLVVPTHRGFTGFFDRSGDVFGIKVLKWVPNVFDPNARLVEQWSADSDWMPTEGLTQDTALVWTFGYTQPLSPVIVGQSLYVPGKSGTLHRLDLATGRELATIDPLAGTGFSGDVLAATTSMLSASTAGTVYYTVTVLPTDLSISSNARASYLVEVTPDDKYRIAEWSTLATLALGIPDDSPGAPLCSWEFFRSPEGRPTSPDSVAPLFHCGKQRPAFNTPVSIDPTSGHLVVFSIANNQRRNAYLIDIDPTTLRPLFASSTLGHMLYACGVRFDLSLRNNVDCNTITAHGTVNIGRDPDWNQPVGWQGEDLDENAIVIAPNGDRSIGGYDGGFVYERDGYAAQGSTITFDRTGAFKAYNGDYGWKASPVVWQHGSLNGPSTGEGTFSYLIDRNIWAPAKSFADFHVGMGSYDPNWHLERATNVPETFVGIFGLDGNLARDFVNMAPAFAPTGERYAVNGDGHVYSFTAAGDVDEIVPILNADGTLRQLETIGNAWARDNAGRLYVGYGGSVYVIAGGDQPVVPHVVAAPSHATPNFAGRAKAMGRVRLPEPN